MFGWHLLRGKLPVCGVAKRNAPSTTMSLLTAVATAKIAVAGSYTRTARCIEGDSRRRGLWGSRRTHSAQAKGTPVLGIARCRW